MAQSHNKVRYAIVHRITGVNVQCEATKARGDKRIDERGHEVMPTEGERLQLRKCGLAQQEYGIEHHGNVQQQIQEQFIVQNYVKDTVDGDTGGSPWLVSPGAINAEACRYGRAYE